MQNHKSIQKHTHSTHKHTLLLTLQHTYAHSHTGRSLSYAKAISDAACGGMVVLGNDTHERLSMHSLLEHVMVCVCVCVCTRVCVCVCARVCVVVCVLLYV